MAKAKTTGKASKKRTISVTIDLDELERLYRELPGIIRHDDGGDGDTKGGGGLARRRRRADGDTKSGLRAAGRRRLDGDTKGGGRLVRPRLDGDTKGGARGRIPGRIDPRVRPDGDTKGGGGARPRRPGTPGGMVPRVKAAAKGKRR